MKMMPDEKEEGEGFGERKGFRGLEGRQVRKGTSSRRDLILRDQED